MSGPLNRRDIERRYVAVMASIPDPGARPSIPHDSALEGALANDAAIAHHFDVQWGHTRFARDLVPEAVVLDAGCGAGDLSLLLAICGAQRVVSVDFQQECVEFTEWLAHDHAGLEAIEVLRADAASLQLPPGGLDAVFSIEAISHYRDPDAFLDTVAVALRPGGLLFISDGNNGASSRVASANQEVWDFFEGEDTAGELRGHIKQDGCYRTTRKRLILEEFPTLSETCAARYADWTFGMSREEIRTAVSAFAAGDTSARQLRVDGACPKDPETDCAMERLFDPRELAKDISRRGFSCRVVSNGPARRDLALGRIAWELLSPVTIKSTRGFSLVCWKKNG